MKHPTVSRLICALLALCLLCGGLVACKGSSEIPDAIRQGHIAYFINTKNPGSNSESDGAQLRQVATEYNVTMFTSLDTVKALLDVLEETTLTISTIDA